MSVRVFASSLFSGMMCRIELSPFRSRRKAQPSASCMYFQSTAMLNLASSLSSLKGSKHWEDFELIWRGACRTKDAALKHAVTLTLDRMSQGGIYDHLGGGFARYATDAEWLVPHFEKMLYDNAQLVDLLTQAWQDGKSALYAMRDFLYARVYESKGIASEFEKAQRIIEELWRYFHDHSDEFSARFWPRAVPESEGLDRAVGDFLCGMTDRYAMRLYQELRLPKPWTVY